MSLFYTFTVLYFIQLQKMADDIDMEKPVERSTVSNDCVVKSEKMFSLKRWNAVAMWSWDVECEICAICRVQVMGKSHFQSILLQTRKSIKKHVYYSLFVVMKVSLHLTIFRNSLNVTFQLTTLVCRQGCRLAGLVKDIYRFTVFCTHYTVHYF